MIRMTEQMWGAALALSPTYLIDKFLDWLDELSFSMLPAQVGRFASVEVRTEAMRDPFNS
jgi:hypothetical protein